MIDSYQLTAIATEFLMPPLILLLPAAIGCVLLGSRYRRLAHVLVVVPLVLLALLSTPVTASWLVEMLESDTPALVAPREAHADAIVVLGGGRIGQAPEYGGADQPGLITLTRLRYAAWLHQQTGLPILTSGGSPGTLGEPEAALMARTLRDSFKVPVRWEEGRSDNTAQNAIHSAAILREAGIRRVLLVTDALHMPRSRRIFHAAGLDVVPAPVRLDRPPQFPKIRTLLPQSGTLDRSRYALHEWVGMVWHRIRYRQSDLAPADR